VKLLDPGSSVSWLFSVDMSQELIDKQVFRVPFVVFDSVDRPTRLLALITVDDRTFVLFACKGFRYPFPQQVVER
jgi:hypothetical protein